MNGNTKPLKSGFFAAFVILGTVACVGVSGVTALRVFGTRDAAVTASRDSFAKLRRLVSSAWTLSDTPIGDTFRSQVGAFFRQDERLAFVCVYSEFGGPLYVLPRDSSFSEKASGNWPGHPELEVPDYTCERFTAPVNAGSTVDLRLDAVYVTLSRNDVFLILRDGAIAMAAWLLLSLALVLIGRETAKQIESVPDADCGESPATEKSAEATFQEVPLRETIIPPSVLNPSPEHPDIDLSEFPDACPDGPRHVDDETLPTFDLEPPESLGLVGEPGEPEDRAESDPGSEVGLDEELGVTAYIRKEKQDSLETEEIEEAIIEADVAVMETPLPSPEEVQAQDNPAEDLPDYGFLDEAIREARLEGSDISIVLAENPEADQTSLLRALAATGGENDVSATRKGGAALLLRGKNLDEALDSMDAVIGGMDARLGNEGTRLGMASLAGRKIDSAELVAEAERALQESASGGGERIAAFKARVERA